MKYNFHSAIFKWGLPMLLPWVIIVAGAKAYGGNAFMELERFLESGQMDRAQDMAARGESPEIRHYMLSRISFYAGDYRAARDELRSVLAEGSGKTEFPGGAQLERYYDVLFDITKNYHEYKSEHFSFHASGPDTILSRYALDCMEEAYREIGGELDCFPAEPVRIELYPDKKTFSFASTLSEEILERSGTVGICKFNRIMLLSPQALPLGYRWEDTLTHEYVHYLINRLSQGRCPLWLHEGIARYLETRWRMNPPAFLTPDAENHLLEARKNRRLIPFKKMYPSMVYLKDRDEITLAFAEVSSTVDFLCQTFGSNVIRRLLQELAASNEEVAFRKVLGISTAATEKRWIKFLSALSLESSPGTMSEQAQFGDISEEEFIGADQRGLIRLGDKMRQIGRPDAALIQYEKALSAEPANPVILLKIARCHIAAGKNDSAEQSLQRAMEKNPNYVTPYQVLGELYFTQGRHDRSIEAYRNALSINPFHPDTHRTLSRCYLLAGKRSEALYELEATLILDPGDVESKVILERLKQ